MEEEMTLEKAVRLLKLHRNSSVKPTEKVREAIDLVLNELSRSGDKYVDPRVRPLQMRCKVLTSGQFCHICTMDCDVRVDD